MTGTTERSPFAGGLARCIAVCEATLAAYAGDGEAQSPFAGTLLRTTAALKAAAESRTGRLCRDTLAIAAATARETAAAIRRHGLDERLLRCAEACERAAFLCEDVLPQAA